MRVVLGLHDAKEADSVKEALRGLGAGNVQGPSPELPDVLIADFPAVDRDADEGMTVDTVASLPAVRYAEPEEFQSIQ